MDKETEKVRKEKAEYFAKRLCKYLWSEVNGTSPVVKVAPCELSTDHSVLLEMNDYRAYSPADLDSIDSMDNEVAWETETKRIGDHLLAQIRHQIASRDKSERNDIVLSGDLADVRKAILGDIVYITREVRKITENRRFISSGKRVFSTPVDTSITGILEVIGSVIEKRLNQIYRREETIL